MVTTSTSDDEKRLGTLQPLTHDVVTSNHDRDFRFWPLFNGEDTDRHNVNVRIAELNTNSSRTRLYNYQGPNGGLVGGSAIYLLAHRGHMRFTKQSRLTTKVRWGKRQESLNNVIDLAMTSWSDIVEKAEPFGEIDVRQCHRFPAVIGRRL